MILVEIVGLDFCFLLKLLGVALVLWVWYNLGDYRDFAAKGLLR